MQLSLLWLARRLRGRGGSGDDRSGPGRSLPRIWRRSKSASTVHTLPNGYTFLILERPGAPVFSFATRVDVGSAQEVPGITGLAHMFEHMAFKGTPRLGTPVISRKRKSR